MRYIANTIKNRELKEKEYYFEISVEKIKYETFIYAYEEDNIHRINKKLTIMQ